MVEISPTLDDASISLSDPVEAGAVETTETADTNDKQLSDYIGGGAYPDSGLSIGINDAGRVTESITTGTGGPTSGSGAGGPDIAADLTTTHVGTLSPDTTVQETQAVEQELEKTSGGTAFGDPSKVEEIGSGNATTTVATSDSDPTGDTESPLPSVDVPGINMETNQAGGGFPRSLLVAGAALVVIIWGT